MFAALVGVSVLPGCDSVRGKEAAAVVGDMDLTFCGYCGGWFVSVDSVRYRAEIDQPFREQGKRVWIRYKKDESDEGKKMGKWIIVTSIRERK